MKAFCEKCRDIVEYNVELVNKEKSIKGNIISYKGKKAYCNECGDEIFVSEIRDFNLRAMDDSYRKAEDLIHVDDIKKILVKYDIGKRPLSLLLKWGEGTITRYIDGDIPSKTYSDILTQILNDKEYYRRILEGNRESISPVAYRKSAEAIDNLSNTIESDISKLESTVKYLLSLTSEITPHALQKLLYYAQGFQKAFTNRFLFPDDCEAWVHGPVYRSIYEKYKNYGCTSIEEKLITYHFNYLSDDEKQLLNHVVFYFGCYSGKVLENMTHSEKPWRMTRQGLADDESSNRIIEKEAIETYFNSVKIKYNMLNFTDIKDYSTDLFNKLHP